MKAKTVLCKHQNHTQSVHVVRWSFDGNYLASASHDGTVCVWQWNKSSKAAHLVHRFNGNGDAFLSLAWSRDGKIIAAGTRSTNGTVFVWNIALQKETQKLHIPGSRSIYAMDFLASGDLACGQWLGHLVIYNVNLGVVVGSWLSSNSLYSLNVDKSGNSIVCGTDSGIMFILKVNLSPRFLFN